ncbi:hypothetical protein Efla_005892 [Eimeria flavescens]
MQKKKGAWGLVCFATERAEGRPSVAGSLALCASFDVLDLANLAVGEMAKLEPSGQGSFVPEAQSPETPDDADSLASSSEMGSPRSSGRMRQAKQQLKTSTERLKHSFSSSRKQKAQPRRVEGGDSDEEANKTGPSTAFFSPPSFQLTQIIHDSHCFLPRQGHACVAGGGDVLIFGGRDAEGQLLNDFIRYIPGINAFEPMKKVKGQIPMPRTGATMVTWVNPTTNREQLFLYGGVGPTGDISTGSLYDPATRSWSVVNPNKKPPPRSSHVSVVFEKVFVHGGLHDDAVRGDMWMWDGAEWAEVTYDEETPPMPPRCGHSASAWVHKKHKEPCIFFFGGDTTGRGLASNEVWIFSLKTKRWKHVTAYAGNAPSARFGHSSCIFDSNWVIISGGFYGGWISNYVQADMHTYDLQANCWFSVEMCGVKSNTCLTHLVMTPSTRTVYSFGAQDIETGSGPASSDVYRLSPLITYVSFAALRNQVDSMSELINLSFDSQSEGVGRAIRKVDALMKRLETVEKEVEGLRRANEHLSRQLDAACSSNGRSMTFGGKYCEFT